MPEQPDLRPINSKEYVLYEDFIHEWREPSGQWCRQITYSRYVTDIASVPAICAILGYKPDGLHRKAALGHDRRYQRMGFMAGDDILGPYEEFDASVNRWVPKDRKFTREQCDLMFEQDMLEMGEDPHKALNMFKAVRYFGGLAWK